jgi:oleate hydratase
VTAAAVNTATVRAHFVGGGIGSLAAAAFMIRDGMVPGENIAIYEAMNGLGGALDGAGNAIDGYRLRGGRMLTSDNYECVWDLFKTIPSLENPSASVFDETMAFNKHHVPHAQARLVLLEFTRIETLAGVKRTKYNQYDSLVRPLLAWLETKGVHFIRDCTVTDFVLEAEGGALVVRGFECIRAGETENVPVATGDLVFFQNGSMVDASSFGTMSSPPEALTKADSGGWRLWEKLAKGRPEFGKPSVFNSHIAESYWQSFTVTLRDTAFFDHIEKFSGNQAGIGGLVTLFESNWLMSIVLYHQPHFPDQPADVQVFWGYALHPDRIGNFVAKPMAQCSGKEILAALCGHLNIDAAMFEFAICIPCRMPYITSMFMPRAPGDRPQPIPANTKNFAMISQFVEIPVDVVFTVEYSVRVAQTVVYQLLGMDRQVTPITANDKSIKVRVNSVIKAFA